MTIRLKSDDVGKDRVALLALLGGAVVAPPTVPPAAPPTVPPIIPPPVVPPVAPPVVPPVTPPVINPPIEDGTMLPHVKFFGDAGNAGNLITQARHDVTAADAPTAPCFMVGKFRSEDFTTFGMLCSFGNQSNRGAGIVALSTQGNAIIAFEWYGLGWQPFAAAGLTLNKWQHVAFAFNGPGARDLVLDGVHCPAVAGVPPPTDAPWPSANADGTGLAVTFGSYYNLNVGAQNPDSHCLNGSLRDWALVEGVATDAELARHNAGESAVAIWGAPRVWGEWPFKTIPVVDTTGKGHDLTLIDAGTQAGHTLPVLVPA